MRPIRLVFLGFLFVIAVGFSPWVSERVLAAVDANSGLSAAAPNIGASSLDANNGASAVGADISADVPGDWLSQIQKDIAAREYHLSWQDRPAQTGLPAAWQAPNRAHDFRTYFTPQGIHVIPREEQEPSWELKLSLSGYGRGDKVWPLPDAQLSPTENRVDCSRGGIEEWYLNSPAGLKQGFLLPAPPEEVAAWSGVGPLAAGLPIPGRRHDISPEKLVFLDLAMTGGPSPVISADGQAVEFATPAGERVARYTELKVSDASGRKVPAWMEGFAGNSQRGIRLVLDESEAVYPLTIDPLLTSPAWTAESNQTQAYFGDSVSTAGDIDGDGYTDVIVGAHWYDNGQTNEGAVFAYHGSSTGLATTPIWTGESNKANAWFGYTVATAGDVNGDGHADVIIGAHMYNNGESEEGRAFVYHGGAARLSSTPDWTTESNQVGARFGYSVATAGDVNGDGYSDVIVGSHMYSNDHSGEGMAFVYHGSPTGLTATPDWTGEGNKIGARYGYSVATAGDVNGDGYADVIIGATLWGSVEAQEGRALVYHGSATGLAPSAAWAVESNVAYANLGSAVATAGDINGDGYADVIVGALQYDNGQPLEGKVFIYHGSAAGLNTSHAWTAEGNQDNAQFGFSLATAGDVNGDGYADVIVGAKDYDNAQADEGMIFVYYGSTAGLAASADWTAEINQAGARFGYSVATAGDVNGDGYADVIVGANLFDNGQSDEGRAVVYHGSAAGLSAGARWTAESNQAEAKLGYSVGTAGDVNGDGYADVIVGAHNYDNGQADEGAAFVYHGSETGLTAVPDWMAESDQADAWLGRWVATAGDVNGDGFSDVIVGANFYDNDEPDEGRAFVYHGSAAGLMAVPSWTAEGDQADARFGVSVATAGDVNGDGFSDVIVGANAYDNGETDEGRASLYHGSAAGLMAVPSWTAEGDQADARFGVSVATAGDLNGDGFSDVVIGAFKYDNGETDEGRAFAYHGSAAGLGTTAIWTAEINQPNAVLGRAVASAGDVNGDGYADVIVGAYYYDNGQVSEGLALVYHGSVTGLATGPAWSVEGNRENSWLGYSVAGAGDVNGDGYADVIVGAHGYDNPEGDEGLASVYHGSASGLAPTAAWTVESNQASAWLGFSVATAGDVNGDGYADVIVGAYEYDNGQSNEGMASVYYGNDGNGLALTPQQRRSDDTAPIAPAGWSESRNAFRLSALGRTPFGRSQVKLQWEVKPLGTPLDGTGTGQSAAWLDTDTAGASLSEMIAGLTPGVDYHWRVRLLYDPVITPFQQASRWFTVPWNGWNETDLATRLESSLSITQTDIDPTVTTQGVEYTLSIANTGPDMADTVMVSDTLPVNSAFVSATPSQGSCSESGGVVTCSLGTIPASGGATIDIAATATTPGVYINAASVTGRPRDPNTADNSSTEDTTVLETRIGGLVWEDRDGDGIQGAVEPSMGGIFVELLDNMGTPVNLTLTAGDGSYSFPLSAAPVHQVRFTAPSGWVFTMPDQGSDDTLDSDADVFNGETTTIGPTYSASDITRWSAGLRRLGPCFAPDEPLFIENVRMVGSATVLDYQDGNQPEQVTGYNVYRSSDAGLAPDFWPLMGSDVVDMDAATPNIQWVDDTGDVSPSGIWYYDVAAYNSACDAEGPR